MSLQKLRDRNASNIKPVQLGEETIYFRKLTAAEGEEYGKALLAAGHTDPDGPEPTAEQKFAAHILLLSRSIVSQDAEGKWVLCLDSDEGRTELHNLSFADATYLHLEALRWSGMIDESESKKN